MNLIRPVVLEMQDADPCVPLRLTSIAASEELSVVVTLAGPGRAVPMNHLAVEVNSTRINWFGQANNYQQLVAAAIDEAAGRAFVTESAQPGTQLQGLWSAATLDTKAFASATNLKEFGIALFQSGQVWLHADAAQVFADKASIVEPIFKTFGVKEPVAVLGQLWVCGAVWAQPWRTPAGDGACRTQGGNPFIGSSLTAEDATLLPVRRRCRTIRRSGDTQRVRDASRAANRGNARSKRAGHRQRTSAARARYRARMSSGQGDTSRRTVESFQRFRRQAVARA